MKAPEKSALFSFKRVNFALYGLDSENEDPYWFKEDGVGDKD